MKKHLLFIFAFVALLLPLQAIYPQTAGKGLVTGAVIDEKGQPIVGATIMVVGTTTGTTSGIDGRFSIKAAPDATLRVSFIGNKTQDVDVNHTTDLKVVMVEASAELEELVVVGYGVRKKASLTGAVSVVGSEEISVNKNQNVLNTLTGKLPGVRVVQRGNEPGQLSTSLDIRGMGAPLVVVDGIPRNNMDRMDPNEIESISVLKDAAAAVYGVRAGNGVVLITTKKGEKGKINLSYSFNQAFDQGIGLVKPVDALTQMYMTNEATMTKNYGTGTPYFSDEDFKPFLDGTRKSYNWNDAMLRKIAPSSTHNISVSGASDKVNYFVNLGYVNQGSLWQTNISNYNRLNIRSNLEIKVHKRLTATLKIGAIVDNTQQQYEPTVTVFTSAWKVSPREAFYANDNPLYYNFPSGMVDFNPLALIDKDVSGYRKSTGRWSQNSIELAYEIPGVEGLTAKGIYSYDYSSTVRKNFRKSYNLYRFDKDNSSYIPVKEMNTPSRVSHYYDEGKQTLMQFSLNYKRSFGDNAHNVTAGLFYEEQEREGFPFFAKRYIPLPIDQINSGTGGGQEGGAWDNSVSFGNLLYHEANRAFIGSMHYDYKSKYLVDFNFRYDGSSKFVKGNQFGFFPSVSAGWRISEESFIRNNPSLSFINNLKIRASYGKLGDDASADPSKIFQGFAYPAGSYIVDGSEIVGAQDIGMVNANLSWLDITNLDVGIDVSLWDGKLDMTVDYFKRMRKGIPARRTLTIPGTVGVDLPQENLNSDHVSGFEVVMGHKNRVGEFLYNISASYSFTRSMTDHVERLRGSNPYEDWYNNMNGRYNGIWWGKQDNGQFQSIHDISRYPIDHGTGNRDMLPGDYQYEDWNGDGVIDSNDNHPILRNSNNGTPFSYFSVSIGASYKSFDLSMLIQGALWNYVYFDGGSMVGNPFVWGPSANTGVLDIFEDRWRPTDPKADPYDPATKWIKGSHPSLGKVAAEGTAAIQNARYVRLKNIEIGYTLPVKLLSKLNIEKVRIYVNAYNLFTISPLKYVDPEHPSTGFGADYPLTRTYNVGFNITF